MFLRYYTQKTPNSPSFCESRKPCFQHHVWLMPYIINLLSNLIKYTIYLTEDRTCIHLGGLTPLLASSCAQGTPVPACGGKLIPALALEIPLLPWKIEDEFQMVGQSWQKSEYSQPGQDLWKDSATCSSYWEKLAVITKRNNKTRCIGPDSQKFMELPKWKLSVLTGSSKWVSKAELP